MGSSLNTPEFGLPNTPKVGLSNTPKFGLSSLKTPSVQLCLVSNTSVQTHAQNKRPMPTVARATRLDLKLRNLSAAAYCIVTTNDASCFGANKSAKHHPHGATCHIVINVWYIL